MNIIQLPQGYSQDEINSKQEYTQEQADYRAQIRQLVNDDKDYTRRLAERIFQSEYNAKLSSANRGQQRYGKKGSLSVEIHPSPKVGKWYSHEEGVGGGPLGFIRWAWKTSDAIGWIIENDHSLSGGANIPASIRSLPDTYTPVFDTETTETATPAATTEFTPRQVSKPAITRPVRTTYTYHYNDGKSTKTVHRTDNPDGSKTIRGKGTNTGLFPYVDDGSDESVDNPPVVIVEGEKTVHAVADAGYKAATWCGGVSNVHEADYSIFQGMDVILWPDRDSQGRKAMDELQGILRPIVKSMRRVVGELVEGEDKVDAADWDVETIRWAIANAVDAPEIVKRGPGRPKKEQVESSTETEWEMLLEDYPYNFKASHKYGPLAKTHNGTWGKVDECITDRGVNSAIHDYINTSRNKRGMPKIDSYVERHTKFVRDGLMMQYYQNALPIIPDEELDNIRLHPVIPLGLGQYLDMATSTIMDNAEELSKHYQLNHNYVMSEPVRKALPADGHFQEEPELPLLLEMQPMFRELLLWLGLRVVHPYREFAMLKSIHAKLGKTAIGELLAEALPNVVAYKANPTLGWNKATASRFNVAVYGEMISAKVVFFDEMGDCPDVANFPKHITDPAFMLESKGIDARQYKRTAVAVVMGNNYMSFVARNGRADTRFGRAGFIRNMDNCKPLDNEVGIQIRTSEEIGKLGAYFLWCICHAYHNAASLITQFDPAEDKDTKECLEEWHDYVDNGGDANTVESWLCNIASSRNDTGGILAQDVVLLAKKHGYTIQANRIGRLLKACVPNAESGWIRINGKQVRAWKNIHIEGVPRYGVEEESDTQVEIVPLVEQHTVMEVKSSPVVESRVQTPNEPCITCGRYTLYMDSTQCEWCYNNRRANQHIH